MKQSGRGICAYFHDAYRCKGTGSTRYHELLDQEYFAGKNAARLRVVVWLDPAAPHLL